MIAPLPTDILYRIAQYTTRRTCSRLSLTSKIVHNAVGFLLFEEIAIELGDTAWFESAFKAVETDSWRQVRRVVLQMGDRLAGVDRVSGSRLRIDWDVFFKYWRILIRLVPPGITLEIQDGDDVGRFRGTLTEEHSQRIKRLVTLCQMRKSDLPSTSRTIINFIRSPVSTIALDLSNINGQVELRISGTDAMSYAVSDAENANGELDSEGDEDLKAAKAITERFKNDDSRILQLASWPSTHLRLLRQPINITRLDIEDLDDEYLTDFRKCLQRLSATLRHLGIDGITFAGFLDETNSTCLQMACLQTISIRNTVISFIPNMLRMFMCPLLHKVHLRDCVQFENNEDDLKDRLKQIRNSLIHRATIVTFDHWQSSHSWKSWMQSTLDLERWQRAASLSNIDMQIMVMLTPFVLNEDFQTAFPRNAQDPVDTCTLHRVLSSTLWPHISTLKVVLDTKSYKPSRHPQVVVLSRLEQLDIHIPEDDETYSLTKLQHLLYGLNAPNLTDLRLQFAGSPAGVAVETQTHLLASVLSMYPSLDNVRVVHGLKYLEEDIYAILRNMCGELGIDFSVTLV